VTGPVYGTHGYATYLDVEEQVKPWLQWAGVDTSHDFAMNLITDAVCTEAQRFIGGPIPATQFGPEDGLGKFDGGGGLNSGYIMLPRRPVVRVVSVVEYQGSNPVELSEIDPATGGDGYQVNYRTARLTRVLGGIWNRPFYPGSNNVWVTWEAGFNPIPNDMIWATLDWVGHVYRNSQQAVTNRPGIGPSDEAEPATMTAPLWAGVPNRVIQVFQSYQKVGVA
jgi:hypothetical protein